MIGFYSLAILGKGETREDSFWNYLKTSKKQKAQQSKKSNVWFRPHANFR